MLTLFEMERADGQKVELDKVSATGQSPESVLERVVKPMIQLKRGWSVDPDVDKPHYAVIEPRTMERGGKFAIRLSVGSIHVEERHLRKVWELLNKGLEVMK